jgi:hypothetical protein
MYGSSRVQPTIFSKRCCLNHNIKISSPSPQPGLPAGLFLLLDLYSLLLDAGGQPVSLTLDYGVYSDPMIVGLRRQRWLHGWHEKMMRVCRSASLASIASEVYGWYDWLFALSSCYISMYKIISLLHGHVVDRACWDDFVFSIYPTIISHVYNLPSANPHTGCNSFY